MGLDNTFDMQAVEANKIFVGNLGLTCNEIDLTRLFSQFGEIVHLEIKRGIYGDSLLHGFVRFATQSSAASAIATLDDVKFMGRRLRVNWALIGTTPPMDMRQEQEVYWTQVHVSFTTREMNIPINEALIDALFSQFGEVADVVIKHPLRFHMSGGSQAKSRQPKSGYGFVFFYDRRSALNALQAMRRCTMDNVLFECNLSQRSQNGSEDDLQQHQQDDIPYEKHVAGPLEILQQLANTPLVNVPRDVNETAPAVDNVQKLSSSSPPMTIPLARAPLPLQPSFFVPSPIPSQKSSPPQATMMSPPVSYPMMMPQPGYAMQPPAPVMVMAPMYPFIPLPEQQQGYYSAPSQMPYGPMPPPPLPMCPMAMNNEHNLIRGPAMNASYGLRNEAEWQQYHEPPQQVYYPPPPPQQVMMPMYSPRPPIQYYHHHPQQQQQHVQQVQYGERDISRLAMQYDDAVNSTYYLNQQYHAQQPPYGGGGVSPCSTTVANQSFIFTPSADSKQQDTGDDQSSEQYGASYLVPDSQSQTDDE